MYWCIGVSVYLVTKLALSSSQTKPMPVLVRRYLLSAGVYRCIDVLGVSVYLVTKLALSSSQTKPMLGLISSLFAVCWRVCGTGH